VILLKHKIGLLLILASTFDLYAGIREDFHNFGTDKEGLEKIIENTSYSNNVLSEAYKGLCQTMMAKHVFWPTSKINYFNKGKEKINQAISASPDNCELRYIRLLVQLNAPGFLDYNEEVNVDFELFCSSLPSIEAEKQWREKFIDGLLISKNISDSQKEILTTLKQKVNE
jgi:hypothetical protein